MESMLNYPRLFFLLSLFILWLSAPIGASVRKRRTLKEEEREDFGVVQAATLTLPAPDHRIQFLDGDRPLRSAHGTCTADHISACSLV